MTLWIVYYFLGIYLTIINYLFLPEKYNRETVMQCLHLIFTVPAAVNLGELVIRYWSLPDNIFVSLLLTLILTFSSLFLWGVVVKRIGIMRRSAKTIDGAG